MKILLAQINPTIGEIEQNANLVLKAIDRAKEKKVDILLLPEMVLCGYHPEDLLFFDEFIESMQVQLERIIKQTKDLFVVVGLVRKNPKKLGKPLFNTAAVICDQKLLGYKDKTLLPTYDVFDERRYFEPGEEEKVWEYKNKKISVTICEDMWEHAKIGGESLYHRDPVVDIREKKPDIALNISASPYYFKKKYLRLSVFSQAAKTLKCPTLVCNQVGGNDQLVFDGHSMVIDKNGELVEYAKGFVEEDILFDTEEEHTGTKFSEDDIGDLYDALVLGVKDYFRKLDFTKACIGLSGGVDSALTACIAVDALGEKNVLCVNMPSRFSSLKGIEAANELSDNLKVKIKHIPIDHIFQQYLDLMSPHFANLPSGVAEENLQARIRGMILMGLSNKLGYIILSTGNKSEMAIGYCTLYGDMCGGLGVLNDVPKTLVYDLCHWVNRKKIRIPKNIIEMPPSAELKKDQKDSDSLPKYSILDPILAEYVEDHESLETIVKKHPLEKEEVKELIRKIHEAEYKRRQGPPGIRVTKKSFSKGRQFPIVQKWVVSKKETSS